MPNEPIHWGTWKGRVLKAISLDGAKTWDDIRNQTGLSHNSMKRVFSELFVEEILIKIDSESPTIYRVVPEVYHINTYLPCTGIIYLSTNYPLQLTANEYHS